MDALVREAAEFACWAHRDHKRKYTGEPYFCHLEAVANLVAGETDDPDMIAAAYLHDTVEDTDTTVEYIERRFGLAVAAMVEGLTDVYTKEAFPELNRAARKALEAERMETVTPEVKLIKMADIADNTKDIVGHDAEFAKVYLKEKDAILAALSKVPDYVPEV